MGAEEGGINPGKEFERIKVQKEGVLTNFLVDPKNVNAELTEDSRDFTQKEIPTYRSLLKLYQESQERKSNKRTLGTYQFLLELSKQLSKRWNSTPTFFSTRDAISKILRSERKVFPYSLALCLLARIKYNLVNFPDHRIFQNKQNIFIEPSLATEELDQKLFNRTSILIGSGIISLGDSYTNEDIPIFGNTVPNIVLIKKNDARRSLRYSNPSGHALVDKNDVTGIREFDQETNKLFSDQLRNAVPIGLGVSISDKIYYNYAWLIKFDGVSMMYYRSIQTHFPKLTENMLLTLDIPYYANLSYRMENVVPNNLLFTLPFIYPGLDKRFIEERLNGGRYFSSDK